MAKASAPGRTKTRLVPPLTFDEAAALNTAFLQDIADNIQLAECHAEIAAYVAFAPSGSEEFFRRILPPPIGLIDACQPSLGDCLLSTRILAQMSARPPGYRLQRRPQLAHAVGGFSDKSALRKSR